MHGFVALMCSTSNSQCLGVNITMKGTVQTELDANSCSIRNCTVSVHKVRSKSFTIDKSETVLSGIPTGHKPKGDQNS